MSRSVRVTISGHSFSVRTDAKTKYVRGLAAEVERRMGAQKGKASTQQVLMLVAMGLADDLEQLKQEHEAFRTEVRDRSQRILRTLEREASQ